MAFVGPKASRYDYGNKRQWRRRIGRFIDEQLHHIPRRQRRVLYFDTANASETMFWLAKGYSPSCLYAVTFEPADVAHLTRTLRRLGLPDVNRRGADVRVAAAEWLQLGVNFDAINLDFTGPIIGPSADVVAGLMHMLRGAAALNIVLAVTYLAGREKSDLLALYETLSSKCLPIRERRMSARLTCLAGAITRAQAADECYAHITQAIYGEYRSTAGNQVMAYWAGVIEPHRHFECLDLILATKQGREAIANMLPDSGIPFAPRCVIDRFVATETNYAQ